LRGADLRSEILSPQPLILASRHVPGAPPHHRRLPTLPAHIPARFVICYSPSQSPRLPRTQPRASGTVDGSPTLARRPPTSSLPGHPVLVVRIGSPRLGHGLSVRATSRVAERLAMPSFGPLPASGSSPSHQRTGHAAHGPSRALRPPRSSSTRPASIRPCLTPACSGLATLAADTRR
jgi:hypothetical protein